MKFIMLIVFTAFLSACGQVTIHDYANTQPKLDLKTFFQGELHAYGILQNRKGKVTRKFTATISASWQGNTGRLHEVFYFDDGETNTRNWTLEIDTSGKISGTANDVVGRAKGQIAGATMQWWYTLSVPYKDRQINVNIDDWLYLIDDNRIINKSKLKKFGFTVGELTLVIEKTNAPLSSNLLNSGKKTNSPDYPD